MRMLCEVYADCMSSVLWIRVDLSVWKLMPIRFSLLFLICLHQRPRAPGSRAIQEGIQEQTTKK